MQEPQWGCYRNRGSIVGRPQNKVFGRVVFHQGWPWKPPSVMQSEKGGCSDSHNKELQSHTV